MKFVQCDFTNLNPQHLFAHDCLHANTIGHRSLEIHIYRVKSSFKKLGNEFCKLNREYALFRLLDNDWKGVGRETV